MNREAILAAVKAYTLIDDTEMETIVYNQLDNVQDNDICNNVHGYDFTWLKKYYEINTIPTYTTGHVSVVQDSTTVTGDGTTFTAGMVGRVIKFSGDSEYYLISAFVGTTEITLQTAYIGTSLVLSDYTIYAVNYALQSDFKRMEYLKQVGYESPIPKLNDREFANLYPDEFKTVGQEILGYIEGGIDSSSNRLIRFYPVQITRKRIYCSYIRKLPSINTVGATSLIPSRYHQLFVFKLSEYVFSSGNDMEDKALRAKDKFDDLLYKFINEDKNAFEDEKDYMSNEVFLKTSNYHSVNLPEEI
jgi:hypothetical protein